MIADADNLIAPPTDDLRVIRHLAPPPRLSRAEWAESNIVLGIRQPTAYPGPLDLSRTPYLRGILGDLDKPSTRICVLEAGAQTGKTMLGYIALAYNAANDPGPTLVVAPSEDLARSNSANRIQPLLEDSPVTAALIPEDRREGWQLLTYRLPGGTWHHVGANSPANLASRPVRYELLDEVDKYPAEATRGEADAVSLALQRTKTFYNSQVIIISTPTVPTGAIHRYYLRGTRSRYELRCPGCHAWWSPDWSHVRWTAADGSDAHLECPSCDYPLTETERRECVRHGRWTSTNAAAEPGIVSYNLPSYLALWVDVPSLARRFIGAARDPVALRDIVNSEFAQPYVPVDARVAQDALVARETTAEPGELMWPDIDLAPVYGGVDVQKGYIVVVLRQWRRDTGDSHQIYHGILHMWSELDALMQQHRVDACCVDCRYRSDEVYEAALTYAGIWPTAGVSGFRVPALYEQATVDIDEGRHGRGGGRCVQVLRANSNALLDMLADRVAQSLDGIPRWTLPRGTCADDEYVRQMTAMYRSNGAWVNPRHLPEHYADAEKLSILAAAYGGVNMAGAVSPANDNNNNNNNNNKE